jgi:hypothetical protein
MRTHPPILRLLLLAIACLAPSPGKAQAVDQITLLIPAFEGEGALGVNVATALNLRIWPTLRRHPWPENPNELDFGPGLILWDPRQLVEQSHKEAEKQAKDLQVLAQLVLWGKAYHYGGGVVVQANMSQPQYRDYREQHNELWQISLGDHTVIADVPRRRYEIGAIVLRPDVIERYSLPSALQMYPGRSVGTPLGPVGSSYKGLQFEPELGWAKVRSDGQEGWVQLPELGKYPEEVSSFVSGLIKIYRGDWEQAQQAMQKTLNIDTLRTPLRIDANLYAGMALEKTGRSGRDYFDAALDLNPFAVRTVRYRVMSELAALRKLVQSNASLAERRDKMRSLETWLESRKRLFAPDDSWLASVGQALQGIATRDKRRAGPR